MLELLTDEAHEALAFSLELSGQHLSSDDPAQSATVLLALQRQEASFAGRALASLGVKPDGLCWQLEALIASASRSDRPRSSAVVSLAELRQRRWRTASFKTPLSHPPEDAGILEHAQRQANTLGHDHIGTLHLILALLEEPEGVAARALTGLGVQPPEIRRRVLEMLRNGEYREKRPMGARHNRRSGWSIRLEALGDERLADELRELLIRTGIVENPDESGPPGGLSSAERTEPPEIDRELATRIERVARELDERIKLMRNDLEGLEVARDKLAELLEDD